MAKIWITFLKSPTGIGYAYFAGDTAEFEEKTAHELMSLGFAKPVYNIESQNGYSDLPDDIPGRKLLIAANIKTMEDLRSINNITDIEGIGKTVAGFIKGYLNKHPA